MARCLIYNQANRTRLGRIIGKEVLIGKWSKSRKAWRLKLRIRDANGRIISSRNIWAETMRLGLTTHTDEGYVAKISHDWFKSPGMTSWYLKRNWLELDSALPVESALLAMLMSDGKILVHRPVLDWSGLFMKIAGWQ